MKYGRRDVEVDRMNSETAALYLLPIPTHGMLLLGRVRVVNMEEEGKSNVCPVLAKMGHWVPTCSRVHSSRWLLIGEDLSCSGLFFFMAFQPGPLHSSITRPCLCL